VREKNGKKGRKGEEGGQDEKERGKERVRQDGNERVKDQSNTSPKLLRGVVRAYAMRKSQIQRIGGHFVGSFWAIEIAM